MNIKKNIVQAIVRRNGGFGECLKPESAFPKRILELITPSNSEEPLFSVSMKGETYEMAFFTTKNLILIKGLSHFVIPLQEIKSYDFNKKKFLQLLVKPGESASIIVISNSGNHSLSFSKGKDFRAIMSVLNFILQNGQARDFKRGEPK